MNDDHVKGTGKDVAGAIKAGAGRLTGDRNLEAEGRADQVEGKAQKALGDVKDAVGKALGK